jgi:hypothetical protein
LDHGELVADPPSPKKKRTSATSQASPKPAGRATLTEDNVPPLKKKLFTPVLPRSIAKWTLPVTASPKPPVAASPMSPPAAPETPGVDVKEIVKETDAAPMPPPATPKTPAVGIKEMAREEETTAEDHAPAVEEKGVDVEEAIDEEHDLTAIEDDETAKATPQKRMQDFYKSTEDTFVEDGVPIATAAQKPHDGVGKEKSKSKSKRKRSKRDKEVRFLPVFLLSSPPCSASLATSLTLSSLTGTPTYDFNR